MRTSSRIVETHSLEDHARLIREQVDRSLKDPQTRWLAAALAAGNYVWVNDPRTGEQVPAVRYHNRAYRVHPGSPVCGPRDFACEVVSIWNFLVLNTKYVADADGYDTYQDLRTTLETGAGDCDDASVAFCALLRAIGFKCAIRIISQDGRYWSHVYPIVMIPGRGWTALDITEKGKAPGWEFPHAKAVQDFPMGDAA